jgi:hypothetical protein
VRKSKPTKPRLQSRSKSKPAKSTSKTPDSTYKESYSELKKTIAAQARELQEAAEQQTATSEILRIIANSPTDLQSVLGTVAESAARVCNAEDASVRLVDGDVLRLVAHFGPIPSTTVALPIADEPLNEHVLTSGETVHIEDILTAGDPILSRTPARLQSVGVRTLVYAPLMANGKAVGTIGLPTS